MVVSASKTISASESEGLSLTISTSGSNPAELKGSYNLDGRSNAVLSFYTTSGQSINSYLSIGGEITINNISTGNVSGIFNARCVNLAAFQDTIAMTSGIFYAILVPGL